MSYLRRDFSLLFLLKLKKLGYWKFNIPLGNKLKERNSTQFSSKVRVLYCIMTLAIIPQPFLTSQGSCFSGFEKSKFRRYKSCKSVLGGKFSKLLYIKQYSDQQYVSIHAFPLTFKYRLESLAQSDLAHGLHNLGSLLYLTLLTYQRLYSN